MRRRRQALTALWAVVTAVPLAATTMVSAAAVTPVATAGGPAGTAQAVRFRPAAAHDRLRVTGELLKVAYDRSLHHFGEQRHQLRYAIVTTSGAVVPLRTGSLPDRLAAAPDGTPVSADLVLDDAARDRLVSAGVELEHLGDDARSDTRAAQVLEAAATPLELADATLVGGTAAQSGEVGALTTTGTGVRHRVYVVAVSDSTAAGDFSLTTARSVTAGATAYWTKQSRGEIPGFDLAGSATLTLPNSCFAEPGDLWSAAAARFTADTGAAASHLVVFLPSGCADLTGYAGLGTVGGVHTGGQVIVQDPAWAVLAHEFGHNLGLGHSNLELDDQDGAHVQPYYGFFGPQAAAVGTYAPGVLDVAYQKQLGFTAAGDVTSLPGATNRSTVALAPVGALSGVRGLTFTDPRKPGDRYYVEYRTGTGDDAASYYGSFLTTPAFFSLNSRRLDFTPGVRIYRLSTGANDVETLTVLRGTAYDAALGAADTYTAATGGFSVTSGTPGEGTVPVTVTLAQVASTVSLSVPGFTFGSPSVATVKVSAAKAVTGRVDVLVDGVKVAGQALSSASATVRLPASVSAGTHTVTARYLGSATVKTSTRSVTVTVAKARAAVSLVSMSTVKRGRKATVVVGLKPVAGQSPTGRVKIKVGTKIVTDTVTVRKTSSGWRSTLRTSALPRGTVKIIYSGNANLATAVYGTGRTVR